jgi:hypothetical protein
MTIIFGMNAILAPFVREELRLGFWARACRLYLFGSEFSDKRHMAQHRARRDGRHLSRPSGATFNMLNGLIGLAFYAVVALAADHHLYRQFYVAQAAGLLILIPIVLVASRRQRLAALLNPS